MTDIDRVAPGSEAAEVLTDAQIADPRAEPYEIVEVYPVDHDVPADHDLLWDTERKILSDGSVIVTQIRPHLR